MGMPVHECFAMWDALMDPILARVSVRDSYLDYNCKFEPHARCRAAAMGDDDVEAVLKVS